MKKFLLTFAIMMVGLAAYALDAKVVLIDVNGQPHEYVLTLGDAGYTNMIAVDKDVYGHSECDKDGNIINQAYVDFYYEIDGVKYYAKQNGDTRADEYVGNNNPLTNTTNYYYYVETGWVWVFGLDQLEDGSYVALVTKARSTSVDELNANKTVAGVSYFNMAGQQMSEANGMTIVVTTYTDGTTSTAKVVK